MQDLIFLIFPGILLLFWLLQLASDAIASPIGDEETPAVDASTESTDEWSTTEVFDSVSNRFYNANQATYDYSVDWEAGGNELEFANHHSDLDGH